MRGETWNYAWASSGKVIASTKEIVAERSRRAVVSSEEETGTGMGKWRATQHECEERLGT